MSLNNISFFDSIGERTSGSTKEYYVYNGRDIHRHNRNTYYVRTGARVTSKLELAYRGRIGPQNNTVCFRVRVADASVEIAENLGAESVKMTRMCEWVIM